MGSGPRFSSRQAVPAGETDLRSAPATVLCVDETRFMRIKLAEILFAIRSNFWFIPTLLSLIGIIAALLIVDADIWIASGALEGYLPNLQMPLESARPVLSTIAGSMITVASLVFSLTLVALTMISQQLGPRPLLHFMDDRPTQIVLGLFVATFLFALVALTRLDEEVFQGHVPGFAVITAVGLSVASLGMVIHFIHHIATRIQADVLIAELGAEFRAAAQAFVRQGEAGNAFADRNERVSLLNRFGASRLREIALESSGYLLRFDADAICRLAKQHGLILRMEARPGAFVLAGSPLLTATAEGDAEVDDEKLSKIRGQLSVGSHRTPQSSIEFELKALVEVALRALSPGVNDPYTAAACIDRLADGMRVLMGRETEQQVTRDADGQVRIIHQPEPFERNLSIAFDPIIRAGQDQEIILSKFAEVLSQLRSKAHHAHHKEPIDRQLQRVAGLARRGDFSEVQHQIVVDFAEPT
ncbi:MAG: DUF2254 domain-containing protein [Dichotomicrobium sp.]